MGNRILFILCICINFFIFSFISNAVAVSKKAVAYQPVLFLDQKIAEIKNTILSRNFSIENASAKEVHSRATRNDWLHTLYENNLVEASELTKNFSDKLVMAKLIESFVGAETASRFHPKTMGLKYLLIKNNLLDAKHNLISNQEKVKQAFQNEFPLGFIVKPAAGINSEGKSKGFYFKMEKFYADLFKQDSELYLAKDYSTPFRSPLLEDITSGETYIIQENIVLAGGKKSVLTAKEFVEVRVHTFEGKVVPQASYPRWKETKVKVTEENILDATKFVQEFLDVLPKKFLQKQAWSLDVAVLENGYKQIIDINTNRGKEIQWSGYMPRPSILAAYTNFLENDKKLHFAGISGFLLRHGMGNYPKYLRKVYIEGIR